MGRCGAGLLLAVLTLAGCKSTSDPKTPDREPLGKPAARSRTKDSAPKGPAWLEPIARLPGTGTAVPKALSGEDDPSSPNFDPRTAAQDAVGGRVFDAYNRPAKNIFIRIEAANDSPGATAKGIYTDGTGYFITRGLEPGTTYTFTAEATQDGKQLTGTIQTRVPSPAVTIILREDQLVVPGVVKPAQGTIDGFPPPPVPIYTNPSDPAERTPRTPQPLRSPDGAYSPGGGIGNSVPPTLGRPTPTGALPPPNPKATTPALPEPDSLTPPGNLERPENIAGMGRNPFTPPATSIPGGPSVIPTPRLTAPTPTPSLPALPSKQPFGTQGLRFQLTDTLERNWVFPDHVSGSIVLVEFVTTNCPHCKPAVPTLKDLQSRYGAKGLQVIVVLCDELPSKQRIAAAKSYANDNNTNYPIFIEPGPLPGAVRDVLGVESYPRVVLLHANGTPIWRGHPSKKAEMETAIRGALK